MFGHAISLLRHVPVRTVLLLCALSVHTTGQVVLNGTMEEFYTTEGGQWIPLGWGTESSTSDGDVTLGFDWNDFHDARPSMRVRSRNAASGGFSCPVTLGDARGDVTFNGWVKLQSVQGTFKVGVMRFCGDTGGYCELSPNQYHVAFSGSGTSDWQQFQLTLPVPTTAECRQHDLCGPRNFIRPAFAIHADISGTGTALLDDLAFGSGPPRPCVVNGAMEEVAIKGDERIPYGWGNTSRYLNGQAALDAAWEDGRRHSRCLRLRNDSSGSVLLVGGVADVEALEGETATFSGWLKLSGGTCTVGLTEFCSGSGGYCEMTPGRLITAYDASGATDGWYRFSVVFTAPTLEACRAHATCGQLSPNKADLSIHVRMSGPGTLLLDDLCIESGENVEPEHRTWSRHANAGRHALSCGRLFDITGRAVSCKEGVVRDGTQRAGGVYLLSGRTAGARCVIALHN